jgi:hypothetical protein
MDSFGYQSGNSNRSSSQQAESDKSSSILGGLITLPESTARIINLGENIFKPVALRWFNVKAPDEIKRIVETTFKGSPETAKTAAAVVTNGVLYGSVFYREMMGLYNSGRSYYNGRSKLAQEVAPVLLAGHHSTGIAGLFSAEARQNEVIQVARKRLDEGVFYDTLADLSQLPSSITALILAKRQGHLPTGASADETKDTLAEQNHRTAQARHAMENGQVSVLRSEDVTGVVASLVSEGMKDTAVKKGAKIRGKKCALDMISHLARQVDQNPGAETLDTLGGRENVEIRKYIKDIFNHHQRDMGQPEIGKRNLERLEYACDEIARAIQDGRMHPKALVNLIGERRIIKPIDKGNPDHIELASRSDIDKAISEQLRRMPAKFTIDPDEYFAQSPLTEDDVKSLLGTLKDKERDFFITLLPTEIVRKAGLSEKEDNEARQRIHGEFSKMLRTTLLDIAASSDKELKDAGFNREDISNMREWADRARDNSKTSLVAAVSTHGQFRKGIDFVLAGSVDYWKGIAAKEYRPGELFKKPKHAKGQGESEPLRDDTDGAEINSEDRPPSPERSHKASPHETDEGRYSRKMRADVPEAPRRRPFERGEEEGLFEDSFPAPHVMQGRGNRDYRGRMLERGLELE